MSDVLRHAMLETGRKARAAQRALAAVSGEARADALDAAGRRIAAHADALLRVNAGDCARAGGETPAFLDRMRLTPERIEGIARAVRDVAYLPDPVGAVIKEWTRPNGLRFQRIRTPIGVIAVIFESRPNVTVDAAAIAIKAGNVVILRGGAECLSSNALLARLMREGLAESGLPADALQFIDTPDRAAVGHLLSGLYGAIDLVIPRGGKSLVKRVQDDARVAVLGHLDGVCHVYLDRDAAIETAVAVTLNSKMRRTGVCGAAETLLIDRARLADLYAPVAEALKDAGCALKGDAAIRSLDPSVEAASEDDWSTEYLAPILSVAAVDGVAGAVAHIARYGTSHTETIVTENAATADRFLASVDSAIVLHNASTQFADGGEFGFGAEIGIATGRLHARGPVGVEELTSFKTIVRGTGQVRP
ncbi:MAG TPA: glutamate-5-semialdehyde dehydrogenase [Parvularcula sp.]|nr:glutamate-5-semialdehyde dehydrogenase [Parvularcula sp.]HBS30393.1 glutamate-5-semialdehyde dehydrogenase [Parvularcula sp.]HBS35773.1 glutamate-5-semialdehyde dehydrogenase [Parvularcula sp.]